MKKIICYIFPLIFALFSCGGGGGGGSTAGDGITNLQAGVEERGNIETVGEVDWYRFRANEVRSIVQVRLAGQYANVNSVEDFEFLVTVYEEDASGQKVRLMADHDDLGSVKTADMAISVYVDQPKDLFISVRDYMDDKASKETYALEVNYEDNDIEDNSFDTAVGLTIDGGSCPSDSISAISDVDCYTFTVSETGSYSIVAGFSNSDMIKPAVNLEMELYREADSGQNELVEDLENNTSDVYSIVRPLIPGKYNLMIADQGRNDKDPSSAYTVCVNSVDSGEVLENDARDDASELDAGEETNGSLDYTGDQDWYRISIGENINLFELIFDASGNTDKLTFLAEVYNSTDDEPILSHEILSGSTGLYKCQLYIESPTDPEDSTDHYVVIKAINNATIYGNQGSDAPILNSASYNLTVNLGALDDSAEDDGGNNTILTATPLTNGDAEEGLIGYRGDDDFYSIYVDGPKILEVLLETSELSNVEHSFSIINDGESIIRKYDTSNSPTGTSLKTSIYVADTETIYVKVCDYQGDDGDDIKYNLTVGVNDIPNNLGTIPVPVESPQYLKENPDGDLNDAQVVLSYNTLIQKSFKANTTLLSFGTGDLVAVPGQDYFTVDLPWIGGYVDYDGDNDIYQLNLDAIEYPGSDLAYPDSEGIPDEYYYDIKVQLITATGSEVEYIWKLYIKGDNDNDNDYITDFPGFFDHYIACGGDNFPNSLEPLNLTVPRNAEEEFWVGSRVGNTTATSRETYFSMSDFEFLLDPQNSNQPINFSDNDWGNDTPYYFKITLIYHPGLPRP